MSRAIQRSGQAAAANAGRRPDGRDHVCNKGGQPEPDFGGEQVNARSQQNVTGKAS